MYHFAVDGNEANTQQRVGSNVYAYEVLHALEKLTRKSDDSEHSNEYEWTVLLANPPVNDLPKARKGWQYQVIAPQPFWTQLGLPLHLFMHQEKYNAFFTPGHYAPRYSVIPYISSVMDLGFLKFPDQFRKKDSLQLKEWTRYSVKHAQKVLTISQFTCDAILQEYKRSPEDVFVAYPALPQLETDTENKVPASWVKEIINTSDPYILYVGTLQPRKNLVRLVKAFEILSDKHKDKKEQSHLVIVGKVGWLADQTLKAIDTSEYKDRIHLLGYVTEEQKHALYKKSACAVLIGTYEGFGIPPLEAMAANTIPVVANTSSLPEVVGEAGFQVSPTHPQEIADVFADILKMNAKQRAVMLKKGRAQLKKFSWQKTAQIILDQLQEVSCHVKK